MKDVKIIHWINESLPKYELLGKHVAFIVENILKQNGIDYLSVSYRTKTKQGVIEKIERKKYKNPMLDMTDISGVRVILYLDSDISKACSLIAEIFKVDKRNSMDNEERLSSDRIGYRSMHYVCEIGQGREQLREYELITGLKFEIQIRTMLQHAWAELTHDRNYKLGESLPLQIQRKINLFSAVLEVADQGFTEIVAMIDDYTNSLKTQNFETILNAKIDSISLYEFVEKYMVENNLELERVNNWGGAHSNELIKELDYMGVTTLKALSEMIPEHYGDALKSTSTTTNIYGFIRDVLLIHDFRKLREVPGLSWILVDPDDELEINRINKFYSKFLPSADVSEMINLFSLISEDEDEDEDEYDYEDAYGYNEEDV